MQRVVTLTLPLPRFFMSHKSVSFFFIVETLSTVETVGSDDSFDLLDCILTDFLDCLLFIRWLNFGNVSHFRCPYPFRCLVDVSIVRHTTANSETKVKFCQNQ
jgi:hypothetical protein